MFNCTKSEAEKENVDENIKRQTSVIVSLFCFLFGCWFFYSFSKPGTGWGERGFLPFIITHTDRCWKIDKQTSTLNPSSHHNFWPNVDLHTVWKVRERERKKKIPAREREEKTLSNNSNKEITLPETARKEKVTRIESFSISRCHLVF